MTIGFAGLHLLLPALREIPRTADASVLLLGTQDLAFDYHQAFSFLQQHGMRPLEVAPALRRTTNSFAYVSHEDWPRYKGFLHQETLFRMLGFEPHQLRTLDVDDYEHADIIHDLNKPLDRDIGRFSLILNQGTLEHVFDIRQALWTLSDLTRPGGEIVHMVPAGFLNHGFYNFNAGLFSDFYRQSGWLEQELAYTLISTTPDEGQSIYGRIDPDKLSTIPEGFWLNIFARYRKTAESRNVLAVQGLYEGLHAAWDKQERPAEIPAAAPVTQSRPSVMTRLRAHFRRGRVRRDMRALNATMVALSEP